MSNSLPWKTAFSLLGWQGEQSLLNAARHVTVTSAWPGARLRFQPGQGWLTSGREGKHRLESRDSLPGVPTSVGLFWMVLGRQQNLLLALGVVTEGQGCGEGSVLRSLTFCVFFLPNQTHGGAVLLLLRPELQRFLSPPELLRPGAAKRVWPL